MHHVTLNDFMPIAWNKIDEYTFMLISNRFNIYGTIFACRVGHYEQVNLVSDLHGVLGLIRHICMFLFHSR